MDLRDRWIAFCHRLPPFRGRLAIARIVGQYLLSGHRNRITFAPLANGLRLEIDLGWAQAYESLYYFRSPYEEPLSNLIRAALDVDGGDYIDVGANIGVFCVAAADILRARNGRALAIEPIPSNVRFINDSIAANRLEDVIDVAACAVGDSNGTLQLSQLIYGETVNAIPLAWGAGGSTAEEILRWNEPSQRATGTMLINVPMTTLDELVEKKGIRHARFLKIDVEGAELFVLRGAMEILKAQRPIVYAEFHQELMAANGTTVEQIAAFCDVAQYRLCYLTDQGRITSARPPLDAKYLDAVLIPLHADAQQRVLIDSLMA